MQNKILVHPISALQDNYIWAIIDAQQKKAAIVDPGEAEPVAAFLEEQHFNLQSILITHHHWDHTHGVSALKEKYSVPVYGSANSEFSEITHGLKDQEHVMPGHCPLHLQALSIPGHTLDHLAYYAPGYLFSGDTLFACGCGRIFEGTAPQMYASLEKLAALPEETQVYCGHEYTLKNLRFAELADPENSVVQERIRIVSELREKNQPSLPSTLEMEKKTNPFLRCDCSHLITSVEKYAKKPLIKPVEVFDWLRKWKDSY